MKALVAYDSIFGNTERIARAIANVLGSPGDVRLVKVADVTPEQLAGLRLLVVGSPTRAFRPTPATVAMLGKIPRDGLQGMKVAAFDTRMSVNEGGVPGILRLFARWFGYAAQPISARLTKKGGELAIAPEGFFVKGSEGPLKDGEVERAGAWAKRIKE
jgi:flavodoxin